MENPNVNYTSDEENTDRTDEMRDDFARACNLALLESPANYEDFKRMIEEQKYEQIPLFGDEIMNLLPLDFDFSIIRPCDYPTLEDRARVETQIIAEEITAGDWSPNAIQYAFANDLNQEWFPLVEKIFDFATDKGWDSNHLKNVLAFIRASAGTCKPNVPVKKFPGKLSLSMFSKYVEESQHDIIRAGPTLVGNHVREISGRLAHAAETSVMLGEERVVFTREVGKSSDIVNIQRILDFFGVKIQGKSVSYVDTPGLLQARRLFHLRYVIDGQKGNFRLGMKTAEKVHPEYVKGGMDELRDAISLLIRDCPSMESAVNALEIFLVDKRDTVAAQLFKCSTDWTSRGAVVVESILARVQPVKHDSATSFQAYKTELERYRKLRNHTCCATLYHHNATPKFNCQDVVEDVDRIVPVLKKVIEAKVIPDKKQVYLMSDNPHSIAAFLAEHEIIPINGPNGNFTRINEMTKADDQATLIWDLTSVPANCPFEGLDVLKNYYETGFRPGVVAMRIDLRNFPLTGASGRTWAPNVDECVANFKFTQFAIMKSGRMHTPIITVVMSKYKPFEKTWSATLGSYLDGFSIDAFTVAAYANNLVQRAFEMAFRPNVIAKVVAMIEKKREERGMIKYKSGFLTDATAEVTCTSRVRSNIVNCRLGDNEDGEDKLNL